jgi:hypothetical protein
MHLRAPRSSRPSTNQDTRRGRRVVIASGPVQTGPSVETAELAALPMLPTRKPADRLAAFAPAGAEPGVTLLPRPRTASALERVAASRASLV